jgi:hypothetical protein
MIIIFKRRYMHGQPGTNKNAPGQRPGAFLSELYQALPDSFSRRAASCSSLASDPPLFGADEDDEDVAVAASSPPLSAESDE